MKSWDLTENDPHLLLYTRYTRLGIFFQHYIKCFEVLYFICQSRTTIYIIIYHISIIFAALLNTRYICFQIKQIAVSHTIKFVFNERRIVHGVKSGKIPLSRYLATMKRCISGANKSSKFREVKFRSSWKIYHDHLNMIGCSASKTKLISWGSDDFNGHLWSTINIYLKKKADFKLLKSPREKSRPASCLCISLQYELFLYMREFILGIILGLQ